MLSRVVKILCVATCVVTCDNITCRRIFLGAGTFTHERENIKVTTPKVLLHVCDNTRVWPHTQILKIKMFLSQNRDLLYYLQQSLCYRENELYKFQQILKCHTFRIDNIMFGRKCRQNHNMQKTL